MGRRKGELSPNEVDRRFPHQVILPSECYTGTNFRTVHAFCVGLSLAPRGHSIFKDDSWHYVFCFSEQADAEKFRDKVRR